MNYDKAINILGLSHNFTNKELKKRYREKCLETHPDKQTQNNTTSNEFIHVKEAYDFLSDNKNIQKQEIKKEQTRQNTIVGYMLYFFGIFLNLLIHHLRNYTKTIILKPTINDIIMNNIYKLNLDNDIYYIPLWCDEVKINDKNIIVRIESPENLNFKYEVIDCDKNIFF